MNHILKIRREQVGAQVSCPFTGLILDHKTAVDVVVVMMDDAAGHCFGSPGVTVEEVAAKLPCEYKEIRIS